MAEAENTSWYFDPQTFEKRALPTEVVQDMPYAGTVGEIIRVTYQGARILLSSDQRAFIFDCDARLHAAFPQSEKGEIISLNLGNIRYLLEFEVLTLHQLEELLSILARRHQIHSFIQDVLGQGYFQLTNQQSSSAAVFQTFYGYFTGKELPQLVCQLEYQSPGVLATEMGRLSFLRDLKGQLIINKANFEKAWHSEGFFNYIARKPGLSEEERSLKPFEVVLEVLDYVMASLEKDSELEEEKERFLPPKLWHPDQDGDSEDFAA